MIGTALRFTTLKARKVIGVVVAWTRSRAQGAADTGKLRANPANTKNQPITGRGTNRGTNFTLRHNVYSLPFVGGVVAAPPNENMSNTKRQE